MTPKDGGKALEVRGFIGPFYRNQTLDPRRVDASGANVNRFQVRKVAVLGAGVMGAQIAAHLVNCKVPVVLFDLPAKEGPKNGIVTQRGRRPEEAQARAAGRARRRGADPAGQLRGAPGAAGRLRPGDRGHRRAHGLEARPVPARSRRTGAACDRGPQHLGAVDHQAERGAARSDQAALLRHPLLQPAALHGAGGADQHADHRSRAVLDELEAFVTTGLGKSVVRAKDTPNFIANRVGIAGMLATIKEAETFGLSYDVVDDLTGKKLGRASSGTFRTADVVGLDTMAHVIKTLQDNLARRSRSSPSYATPPVLAGADRQGRAGPEGRRRLLQEGRQGHPAPRPGQGATTCPPAARPTRSSSACSRSRRPSA